MRLTLPVLIVAALWVPLSVLGQSNPRPIHQQTSDIPDARFEVIQSTVVASLFFRLDRFTGRIWQLARTEDDNVIWEKTEVQDLPPPRQNNRPHFVIFSSGIAVRHTFLMDTDTGKSWLLVTAKRKQGNGSEYEVTLWQPFAE